MDFTNGIIQRCPNCPNRDGTFIFSEVPPDCTTIILGEQGGEQENRIGRPFVGNSGHLLDQVLRIAGIDRSTCYVTNAIKCYGTDDQKNECAKQECLNNLLAEFRAIKPKYLLILGSVAQSALDGRTVLDVRGFVREFAGAQCIATLHPAAVFRVPEYFDLLMHDVKKFRRLMDGKTQYQWPPVIVVDTQQKAIDVHKALLEAHVISFDIETESVGLGVPILCVGMYDGRNSYVFDYTVEAVRPYVKSILENPTSKKVGQNLSFDVSQLRCQGIAPASLFFDTMVAHHLIRTYLPHELNTLTSIYTNYPKYDDEKDSYLINKSTPFSAIPKNILHKYNACDTVVVFDMIPALMDELQEYGLTNLFFNISMPLIEVLVNLRIRGVRIDVDRARKVAKDLDAKIIQYDKTIKDTGGPDFNPRSSKQLVKLLYETLRLPIYVRTKKNAPSTSKAALLKLKGKHPVVEALTEHRMVSKVRDTFLSEEFFGKLDQDQRIHTDYKIIGTTVGRLSSAGPNLQNIPRGPLVRNIFTVPQGFKFIEADYEQAELRVAAYLSKDPTMIELFETGKDIHRMVASKMFHKPESEITSEERVLAKFVDFGINYGRGWHSISEQYNKSEEEARQIHDSFIQQFPVMMQWFQEQINFAREHRYVVNSYGRRRWFPMYGQFMSEWEREARAYIPQSMVADTCSRAMIKIDQFLTGRFRSRLVMNLHDAVMVEAAEEELNDVLFIIRTIMEEVVPGMDVPIPVDIKVTNCWKEEKKEEKKIDVVEVEDEEPEFEEQLS